MHIVDVKGIETRLKDTYTFNMTLHKVSFLAVIMFTQKPCVTSTACS